MLFFREVSLQDAPQLYKWRTSERVNSMMLTSISDNLDDQIAWLSTCFDRKDYYHWIINDGDTDIGLVSINQFNPVEGTTSWGYYIGDADKIGAGATVPAYFYNFIFSKNSPITTVTAEILETNPKVIRMHALYGYVNTPELDRIVVREGVTTKLITMKLTKQNWMKQQTFSSYDAMFPMENWKRKPDSYF